MPISQHDFDAMQARVAANKAARQPQAQSNDPGPEFESDLHEEIIAYCRAQSPQWIYIHSSMAHRTRQTLGTPDFIILTNYSRVLFVECKRKSGKESPAQIAMRIRAEELGHEIHVVRSFQEFKSIAETEV